MDDTVSNSALSQLGDRPELLGFGLLLVLFSGPVLLQTVWQSMMFHPGAVAAGEWWRLVTHPFVHVTWYHLLLDGTAFFILYRSLHENSILRRLGFVAAGGAGSLLCCWLAAPKIAIVGLCGLSGIAHGLMAVSAAEILCRHSPRSAEWRWAAVSFGIVVVKSALEALTGDVLFAFLYFGMVGDPVTVSHAGGVLGGLTAFLIGQRFRIRFKSPARSDH